MTLSLACNFNNLALIVVLAKQVKNSDRKSRNFMRSLRLKP
jgi:hypothetical protein